VRERSCEYSSDRARDVCVYVYARKRKGLWTPGDKKVTFLRVRLRIQKQQRALARARERESRRRRRARRNEKDAPRLLEPATTEEAPLDRTEVVVDIMFILFCGTSFVRICECGWRPLSIFFFFFFFFFFFLFANFQPQIFFRFKSAFVICMLILYKQRFESSKKICHVTDTQCFLLRLGTFEKQRMRVTRILKLN